MGPAARRTRREAEMSSDFERRLRFSREIDRKLSEAHEPTPMSWGVKAALWTLAGLVGLAGAVVVGALVWGAL